MEIDFIIYICMKWNHRKVVVSTGPFTIQELFNNAKPRAKPLLR